MNDHDKLTKIGVLVEQMLGKVDSFFLTLNLKADKSDVDSIRKDVLELSQWISDQKAIQGNIKDLSSTRLTIIAMIAGLVGSSLAVFILKFLFH